MFLLATQTSYRKMAKIVAQLFPEESSFDIDGFAGNIFISQQHDNKREKSPESGGDRKAPRKRINLNNTKRARTPLYSGDDFSISEDESVDSSRKLIIEEDNQRTNSYSDDEHLKIIRYIIKNNSFDQVHGRLMWQEMTKRSFKKLSRRWQSLKERFIHRILLEKVLFSPRMWEFMIFIF